MWKRGDNAYSIFENDDHDIYLYTPVTIERCNGIDGAYVSARNLNVEFFTFDQNPKSNSPKYVKTWPVPFQDLRSENLIFNNGHSVRKKYNRGEEVFVFGKEHYSMQCQNFSKETIEEDEGGEFVKITKFCRMKKSAKVPRNCIYLKHREVPHTRCRKAIWAWCLCAKQLGLLRDVTKLIAREIWDLRDEREWE